MVQASVVHALLRVLKDDGQLNVASDHAEYWQDLSRTLDTTPALHRQAGFALDERLPEGELGHTNYEVKYRRSGRAIRQATWVRAAR